MIGPEMISWCPAPIAITRNLATCFTLSCSSMLFWTEKTSTYYSNANKGNNIESRRRRRRRRNVEDQLSRESLAPLQLLSRSSTWGEPILITQTLCQAAEKSENSKICWGGKIWLMATPPPPAPVVVSEEVVVVLLVLLLSVVLVLVANTWKRNHLCFCFGWGKRLKGGGFFLSLVPEEGDASNILRSNF